MYCNQNMEIPTKSEIKTMQSKLSKEMWEEERQSDLISRVSSCFDLGFDIQLGNLSVLFAFLFSDIVVLLTFPVHNLQHTKMFAAECRLPWIRISYRKYQVIVFNQKRSQSQAEGFKQLDVLSANDGGMKQDTDK